MIRAFITTYARQLTQLLLAASYALAFYTGHHWASTACDADKAKLIAAQYEQQTKTIEKVRYVKTKIASMPAGAASNELFANWPRKQ